MADSEPGEVSAGPQEVLTQEVEQTRQGARALAALVNAALEGPGPDREAALARLIQVVARKVPHHKVQGLSSKLVELLEHPEAKLRYVGARLLRAAGEVPAALPGLLRGLGEVDAQVRDACVEALWATRLEPEALVLHLRSERAWEREAALKRVEPLMRKVLQPELWRMLADPVASLRHRVALLLQDDREAPGLWEVLLDAVRTGEQTLLREEALRSLRALGLREEAVPVLLDLLKTDRDERIRGAVAEALETLASVRPEVARALLDALGDAEPEVGMSAAKSLAQRGATTEAVVPRLFEALEDKGLKEAVRGRVALTLVELGERAVVPVLVRLLELPDEAFEKGFDEVTGIVSSPSLKVDVVRALGAGPPAVEAMPALLRCVRTGRDTLQLEAAEQVERLGTAHQELEALLCEVLPGARGWFRPRLLEVLSRLKPAGEGALRELVKALEDEDEQVREPARTNLWRVVRARTELIERIAALTRDEEPQVRSAASRALGVLGLPTAEFLELLSRRLESADASAREDAVGALRTLGSRAGGVLPKLLERLPRLGPESRAAVLTVLGPLSGGELDAALRAELAAGLEDAGAQVREAAAWALGDFPELDAELVRFAEARQTDPEPAVREAVALTLQALGAGSREEFLSADAGGPEQAARALRELAFSLYGVLREGEGNRVFSPLSIFTLLTLVLRGTRGPTESALQRALHWPSEPSRLSAALQVLTERLQAPAPQESFPHIKEGEEGFALVSANGFWPQEGYPLREEYQAELADAFSVRPTAVDFAGAPEAASQVINAWAHEQTRGLIPVLVPPEGLPTATRYVLANAVFFRSRWEQPFEDGTREAPFHLLDGREVEVPMMRRDGRFGYVRGTGYQFIELPYRGGHASMGVLLPDTGFFTRFERLLSDSRVDGLLAGRRWEDFLLFMPRFSFEQRVDLTELAERLGISALFEPDANLSGMTSAREPFTARLLHDATLTVDEKGTDAAAVTRMFHIGGMPSVVEVNRPFLFLIRHVETGAVLFLGRVVDPRVQP